MGKERGRPSLKQANKSVDWKNIGGLFLSSTKIFLLQVKAKASCFKFDAAIGCSFFPTYFQWGFAFACYSSMMTGAAIFEVPEHLAEAPNYYVLRYIAVRICSPLVRCNWFVNNYYFLKWDEFHMSEEPHPVLMRTSSSTNTSRCFQSLHEKLVIACKFTSFFKVYLFAVSPRGASRLRFRTFEGKCCGIVFYLIFWKNYSTKQNLSSGYPISWRVRQELYRL